MAFPMRYSVKIYIHIYICIHILFKWKIEDVKVVKINYSSHLVAVEEIINSIKMLELKN